MSWVAILLLGCGVKVKDHECGEGYEIVLYNSRYRNQICRAPAAIRCAPTQRKSPIFGTIKSSRIIPAKFSCLLTAEERTVAAATMHDILASHENSVTLCGHLLPYKFV